MRPMFLLPLFLLACGGSGQSFSGGGDENNEVSDAGTLEVYPTNEMGIDFGSISVTSVGKMKGFRVSNIGEGTLIVTHVRITDAGENVGKEVFKDLRRADGGQGTNFTLSEGQKMEFTVNASGNTPMDAVGNIEIYTSDISVDIGGPGKYQIPLRISIVDPNANDTGSPDDDDTGSGATDTGATDDDTGASEDGA